MEKHRYQVRTCTGYAYGTRNLVLNGAYFYLVISSSLVQQKRTGVEKITKIILLLMKIVEGMHKKNYTL